MGLADTIGYAGQVQVADLCRGMTELNLAATLNSSHDTRGLGIANAAAIDNGANIIGTSSRGLGGCPFAPGATGNVVFEDIVFLL